MKDLFLYMYYRTARFYKYFGQWDPESVGMLVYLAFISFYINAVIIFLCRQFEMELSYEYLGWIQGVFATIGMFLRTEKLYAKLDARYKDETNRTLKGWLVFMFVFGGLIVSSISLFCA